MAQPRAVQVVSEQCRASARALAITRLALTDFRSHALLRLSVSPRPVVLCGENGAGKTNILEAISFLAPGRGLRQAPLDEAARKGGAGGWAVAASVEGYAGPTDLGTGVIDAPSAEAAGARPRRTVRIAGANVGQQSRLSEVTTVTWLTPAMDRLFAEAAPSRRRFLDRLTFGFDPGHAHRVAAYERVMRQRSKLLRTGGGDRRWFDALEETMAEYAVAIAAARRDTVFRIESGLRGAMGAFPHAALRVAGEIEDQLDWDSALTVEHTLRAKLASARATDAEAGGASHGVHRSDLVVRYLGKDMAAAACSTGEQKALLIGIVLAQARAMAADRGAVPTLLLDEVVAHLDRTRRMVLCAELSALGAQAWLTGTDRGLFSDLDGWAQFFTVADGRATPGPMGVAS